MHIMHVYMYIVYIHICVATYYSYMQYALTDVLHNTACNPLYTIAIVWRIVMPVVQNRLKSIMLQNLLIMLFGNSFSAYYAHFYTF